MDNEAWAFEILFLQIIAPTKFLSATLQKSIWQKRSYITSNLLNTQPMKYLILFTLLWAFMAIFGQNVRSKAYQYAVYDKPLAAIQAYIDSTNIIYYVNDTNPTTFFLLYADSINQYAETQLMPCLFRDPCFDYRHSIYWPNGFEPICLRVGILSKVTNRESLEQILKNKKYRKILKMTCSRNTFFTVANNDVSFYTLIRVRLEKMKAEKENP